MTTKTIRSDKESRSAAGIERSGAQIVFESLIRHNVDLVFGYPGGAVIPLYDALTGFSDRIKHILTRHEQGAVHAAQGYSRTTGKPGVVIATSGPGASNLVTGLMDAHLDSTPLVVIGGQVITDLIGKDAFQECDMMGMTNPVTKHNFQCRNVDMVEEVLDEAFHLATTGRPGPVYIDMPKDVQIKKTLNGRGGPLDLPFYISYRPVDLAAVKRASALIKGASRPLMLIGQGVLLSKGVTELRSLIETLDMPVATTIMAKGAVDDLDIHSLGCVGMHGRRIANYAVAECDVMLAIGCRFSDRITGEPKSFAKGKKIIHIDIDNYEIGKNVPASVELNCDASEAMDALRTELSDLEITWSEWNEHIRKRKKICFRCIQDPPMEMLTPKHVMEEMNRVVDPEDIIVTGVGQHQMFASHYLIRRNPYTFVTSGGAGTMGFGLPAAVGASIGNPNVKVWSVDGDGSLQMTIQELGTMSHSCRNLKIVLIDNGYLGMVRQWQELFHNRNYSSVHLSQSPDFVKIAEAYGISGRSVRTREELREAIQCAAKNDGNMMIHVVVEPESNIQPMIPPGGRVTDFYGYCIKNPGEFFTDQEIAGSDEA